MFAALVLIGLIAAPLSSAALFAPQARPRRVVGAVPAVRRLALAVLGTLLVGMVGYAGLRLLAVPAGRAGLALVLFLIVSGAWLPVTRRWNGRAHVAWVSSVFLFLAYLGFILQWTVGSGLGFW